MMNKLIFVACDTSNLKLIKNILTQTQTNKSFKHMGGFLDSPIKEKNPEPGSNENFYWGACSMQGWRSGMEDTHITQSVEIKGSYG